tara:strand:- start:547 stop:792 length:246 start_codon:yes stop_codon:yes gene_type:complete
LSNHLPLGGLLLARKIFSSSSSSDFSPSAQIALLTGFNHRKRKVSDIDDLRLFLFHNLIFISNILAITQFSLSHTGGHQRA